MEQFSILAWVTSSQKIGNLYAITRERNTFRSTKRLGSLLEGVKLGPTYQISFFFS